MRKLYEWTEYNDWEGETWSAFVLAKDEEENKALGKLVKLMEPMSEDNDYVFKFWNMSETDAKSLVNNASEDEERYLPRFLGIYDYKEVKESFDKLTHILESNNIDINEKQDELDNLAYKMQLFD